MCRQFASNSCTRGADCAFIHPGHPYKYVQAAASKTINTQKDGQPPAKKQNTGNKVTKPPPKQKAKGGGYQAAGMVVTAATMVEETEGAHFKAPTTSSSAQEGESLRADMRNRSSRIPSDSDMRCDRSAPYAIHHHSMFSIFVASLCHMILAGNCTYNTPSLPYACMAKKTTP